MYSEHKDFRPSHVLRQGSGRWQFWQPFRGGPAFVATQGAGWALFAGSLVSLLWLAAHVATGVALRLVAGIRAWVLATGVTMFVAQLVRCVFKR